MPHGSRVSRIVIVIGLSPGRCLARGVVEACVGLDFSSKYRSPHVPCFLAQSVGSLECESLLVGLSLRRGINYGN